VTTIDTTAGLVEKGNATRPRDEERVTVALWRAVDQAVTGEWRGGDEEHRLGEKPRG